MAANTAALLAGVTLTPFITRDTVATDTFANLATSRMVATTLIVNGCSRSRPAEGDRSAGAHLAGATAKTAARERGSAHTQGVRDICPVQPGPARSLFG